MIHPSAIVHDTAYVFPDCIVGKNSRIQAGAKIGTLGLTMIERGKRRPAEGIVIIEEGVEIGPNTVVHRGEKGNTIIRKFTFIGALCNIGHDVEIGEYCEIGPLSLLSGHVKVGDWVRIAPGVTVDNRIKIGEKAFLGEGSLVRHDVPPGKTVVGRPAMDIEDYRKMRLVLRKLIEEYE